MSRPDVEFPRHRPKAGDNRSIARAISEISLYPIERLYSTPKTVTAAYTLVVGEDRTIFADATGGAFTVTLPAAADADYVAYTVVATVVSGGNVTVATGGGNINGAATVVLSTQYHSVQAESDGSNYFRTDNL